METINLIKDYKDMAIKRSVNNNNVSFSLAYDFNTIVKRKLNEGYEKNKLIYTQEIRGIGKTYELIEFAREHNIIVVEPTEIQSRELRDKYGYEKIYRQDDKRLQNQKVLIDESVDIDRLINDMGCDIITGFVNRKYTKDDLKDKDFNSNVVNFLKQEESQLRKSLTKCLENNDFAMYKNLIQAYERVVELIEKYDWQLMYSEYKSIEDGKEIPQVSIWEQNGDGLIRNHKVWEVKK